MKLLPVFLAGLAALAGCAQAPAPTPASSAMEAPHASAGATATAAGQVDAAPSHLPTVPELMVNTMTGEKFQLSQHRGHWVVVNFWATWCTPCLAEIPALDAFDASRADVDVIGLAYEEIERAQMQAFLKQHKLSYPIALLDVNKPPADFETPAGLPMTYLIRPDGTVARRFLGPIDIGEMQRIIGADPGPKRADKVR